MLKEIRHVLTAVEVAGATGVKERQVHHWSSGAHQPKGESRDRLLLLHRLIVELEVALDSDQTKVWLFSRHPELGRRPIDSIIGPQADGLLQAAWETIAKADPADATLVERARDGSTGAYDLLVRRYRGFVREQARTYEFAADFEDLVQEGLLGLYKAIRDFGGREAGNFRGFAELRIMQQVRTAATRVKLGPTISVADSLKVSGSSPTQTGAGAGHGRKAIDDLLSEVRDWLEPDERRLLDLYLDGSPIETIGELTGSSPREIEGWIKTLKKRIGSGLTRESAP